MAKVLFIVGGATYWVLKDGTRHATGYWAEEFVKPYKIVTDAGHEVVVATPNGVTPNVDMMSLRSSPREKVGVNFSRGKIWEPYMVEDRNLVTGQNPASAAVLAKRLLEVHARH
jgi:putative intracellular protease/amidase